MHRILHALTLASLLAVTASAVGQNVAEGKSPAPPRQIRFSGVVTPPEGGPRSAAAAVVSFSLYDAPIGGQPLWTETQNVVLGADGRYSVLLGSSTAEGLPLSLFASGEARWLGVRVAEEGAPEQPRIQLVSVPYALAAADAQSLGGRPASDFVLSKAARLAAGQTAGGDVQAPGGVTSGTVTSLGNTVNRIAKFTGVDVLGNSLLYDTGTNVGIGTTAPDVLLQVKNPADNGATVRIGGNATTLIDKRILFGDSSFISIGEDPTADDRLLITAAQGVSIGSVFGEGLNVAGNISSGGNITATSFFGNGSGLTGLTGAQTGTANTFTAAQTFNATINLPVSTSATVGVVNSGGNRFIHNYGTNNTFVGQNAGNFSMTGARNTAVGSNTLGVNTTGTDNTAAGYLSLNSNTIGNFNSAFGRVALLSNTTGASNTAMGAFSLAVNATSSENTAMGYAALNGTTTGSNSAFGAWSLWQNTTGSSNTGVGNYSLSSNSTGFSNTATGSSALYANTTGAINAAFGASALGNNTTGSGNTAFGFFAGITGNSANSNISGSNNTFLGSFAGPGTSTQLTNATAIGANALVSASNSLVLGDGTVNVGIGTTTPTQRLQVVGNIAASGDVIAVGGNFSGANGGVIAKDTLNDGIVRFGVQGTVDSAIGTGTSGVATSSTGTTTGVRGITLSQSGWGVRGAHYPPTTDAAVSAGTGVMGTYGLNGNLTTNPNATGGIGVVGRNYAAGGNGVGVLGEAVSPTGAVIGVQGSSASASGIAGLFVNSGNGVILSGQNGSGTVFTISGTGTVTANSFVGNGSGLTGLTGAQTNTTNTFTAAQTFNATVNLPATTGSTVGVVNSGGNRFMHNFGTNNFFAGVNAGNFTLTGNANTGLGASSLASLSTGIKNVAVGGALTNATSGHRNIGVGVSTLASITTGAQNVGVGDGALSFSNSDLNVGIGQQALNFTSSGSNNTAVGGFAGDTNTTGSNNTFLGSNADASAAGLTNATAIGANALASASNSLILGNGANVGIGTSTPSQRLHVVGNVLASGTVTAGSFVGDGSGLTGTVTSPTSNSNRVARFTGTKILGDSLIFDNGSNVGIGTTTPAALFHVNAVAGDAFNLYTSTTVGGSVAVYANHFGAASIGYAGFFTKTGAGTTNIGLYAEASGATNNYAALFQGGNVGIGTSAPSQKLQVAGTIYSSSGGFKFPDGTTQTSAAAGGDITAVNVGSGLTGGGASGDVSLAVDGTIPRLGANNTFNGNNTLNGTQTINGTLFVVGNASVSGTLVKGAGSFKIDHPLDPDHKYLSHSFVESPDMKNVYDGVVVLDQRGEAWVQMPDYFDALNKDFRYQLTCVGGFAPVFIAEKVANNRFKIAGGRKGLEVSWQITGTRQDAYANAHRIPVEETKQGSEIGTYMHPELFRPASPGGDPEGSKYTRAAKTGRGHGNGR